MLNKGFQTNPATPAPLAALHGAAGCILGAVVFVCGPDHLCWRLRLDPPVVLHPSAVLPPCCAYGMTREPSAPYFAHWSPESSIWRPAAGCNARRWLPWPFAWLALLADWQHPLQLRAWHLTISNKPTTRLYFSRSAGLSHVF